MFKRISTLLFAALLIFCLMGAALAAAPAEEGEQPAESANEAVPEQSGEPEESGEAGEPEAPEEEPAPEEEAEPAPETSNFYLNGEPVQGMSFRLHGGIVYASIRAFFEAVLDEAQVAWVDGQAEVTGTTHGGETLTFSARPGNCYFIANDRYLFAINGITLEDGVTMAPLDMLLAIFPGSALEWDGETETARVSLNGRLLTGGEAFYNEHEQELDLISRVISSEAGNQPLKGKLAVGNVIMNRVASERFPNSVYDVLYARNQFTIVHHAIFQRDPNAESVIAAKLALEGANVVPGAVYYCTVGLNCWMSRSCPFIATIADHSFYGL